MARVLFTVTYTIDSDKMAEHEELVRRLRTINEERGTEYMVFQNKNNQIMEVTVYPNEEAFDESDDLMEEAPANEYISRINAMAQDIQYNTMYEVGAE